MAQSYLDWLLSQGQAPQNMTPMNPPPAPAEDPSQMMTPMPQADLTAINQQANNAQTPPTQTSPDANQVPDQSSNPPSDQMQDLKSQVMDRALYGDPELNRRRKLYEDALQASQEAEKGTTQSLQSDIDKYRNMPEKMDLTGLLAASDALSGSKFLQNYRPPQTQQDRAKELIDLQNKLAQRQADTARENASLAGKAFSDAQHNADLKFIAQQGSAGNKAQDNQNKADSELGAKIQTVESRGTGKSYGETIRRGENAQKLLNQYPDLNQMPPKMTHLFISELDGMINGGAPTVVGATSLMPSSFQSDWEQFKNRVGNAPTGAQLGEFLKPYQPYLTDVVNGSKQALYNNRKDLIDSYQSRLSPDAYDRHLQRTEQKYGASSQLPVTPTGNDLNQDDPKVRAAKAAGYSDSEIMGYLKNAK